MSDYLWNRRGPADSEIAELERVLAPLRYSQPLEVARLRGPRLHAREWAAIAAGLFLAMAAWQVERVGTPHSTAWTVGSTRLTAGERVRTADTRVTLEAGAFGRVDVEPHSELTVIESGPGRQRMTLERGRIHALIWAPPRQFVVDTPSSRAVDLGCQYTLSVGEAGDGMLSVETGWVAFQFGQRESFIPAGARCRTYSRSGPGIPFYDDAPAEFQSALAEFERSAASGPLRQVLATTRAKDALSLWHLLARTSGEDRRRVFERFAALVPLSGAVRPERAIAGDPETLDLCWNALKLDDADWWREWKREWKP